MAAYFLNKATTILTHRALEAAFRIDYLYRSKRVNRTKNDLLTQSFYKLYLIKGKNARFEDEILSSWKTHTSSPNNSKIISDLIEAFKYRHWLAHGRYYTPKLGKKYDFTSIYTLAQIIFDSFPLKGR
ncbi:hypothetical protein MNBD_GAMMA03-823 [hydrothermal vent metagenome]|uniref:Apea-like HEPN domain-containing protein n=1 Tax=hydrothermal vent metagenome TaxID=652676 RepID=A0A3B0VYU9_9ZZZZ